MTWPRAVVGRPRRRGAEARSDIEELAIARKRCRPNSPPTFCSASRFRRGPRLRLETGTDRRRVEPYYAVQERTSAWRCRRRPTRERRPLHARTTQASIVSACKRAPPARWRRSPPHALARSRVDRLRPQAVDVRRPLVPVLDDYYETLAILVHSAFGLPTRHAPKPSSTSSCIYGRPLTERDGVAREGGAALQTGA